MDWFGTAEAVEVATGLLILVIVLRVLLYILERYMCK